jgi:hypothetical protein
MPKPSFANPGEEYYFLADRIADISERTYGQREKYLWPDDPRRDCGEWPGIRMAFIGRQAELLDSMGDASGAAQLRAKVAAYCEAMEDTCNA